MASLESYGVDEYGNSNGVNLPDFTGCLLLATTPTPPAGTLVADGSEVSREAYSKLFAIFGESQGAGDGSTTFNIPDLRGYFLRGVGGAAAALGTAQGDAIRNITGTTGGYNSYVFRETDTRGAFYTSGKLGDYYPKLVATTNPEWANCWGMSMDISRQVPTASENRPVNVALLWCIIYE